MYCSSSPVKISKIPLYPDKVVTKDDLSNRREGYVITIHVHHLILSTVFTNRTNYWTGIDLSFVSDFTS